jgi:hypothetical protein
MNTLLKQQMSVVRSSLGAVNNTLADVEYNLDDWLTVHRSITLVDLQLDAQNSY